MDILQPVSEARFLRRYKRFLADFELPSGELLTAHCPNTGGLRGCLNPGSRAWLRDSQNPKRKLRHTFQAIEVDGHWVHVDTSLPNALVAEAIGADRIPELLGYPELRREVRSSEHSRIDLLLEGDPERPRCWVEVKTTTYLVDDIARFPDAVTTRGRKHLEELQERVRHGDRAVIFFSIARNDARAFSPADEIDPEYGEALRSALAAGVEALAYTTRVERQSLELARSLPIEL